MKVVERGISIVGKTKMTSFGNWEEPMEYIDYQASWNPRGDAYQSPGGSRSGSAAAIATYWWLDIANGTDSEKNPYTSTVTGNEEHLPFVVALASPLGTDLFLLKTAQDILESASRLTSVSTGKVMFPVAEDTSDCNSNGSYEGELSEAPDLTNGIM
ncbi:hypothetical protein HBH98_095170 [Parastagonospora nodorum]|nr:hypothetical protein HBH53_194230 [Parastagonospora nodorum]KAH4347573.1 hypothetical protein HBH98_095170 [Parastagonospora nodorum]KAH4378642.1 hypothetical protein HBH99_202540 [Parastagonospora nodorum]KAH4388720.1 hypothetical protein HBH97_052200 [Parastagonospora nodorum]KAH4924698.1 hypothetical protein HBI79_160200 [Parastagonospora nodorum]